MSLAIRSTRRMWSLSPPAVYVPAVNQFGSTWLPSPNTAINMTVRALGSKQVKKQKKTKGERVDTAEDKALDVMIRCLDTPARKAPRASDEEMARRAELGRQYVIGKFRQHNELEHDVACKIKMKMFALKMLPRDTAWKTEALKTDGEGPPMWRPIPAHTPPNPDYRPEDLISEEESF
jgi:hypothetical protein